MTFNGHYAVPPTGYYTQPPAVPPFSTPSFQYGIPPPIPPSANVQRFEANSQVPSPPIPYWSPEILKQLSQLPVPPPPPPPIPHALGTPPFVRPIANAPHPQFQNTNNNRIDDLYEKAKQAITDLTPYVRYQDFLDEGISQSVLDKLYSELRLEKDQPPTTLTRNNPHETVVEPPSGSVPEPVHDHPAEPIVDTGLERKDRIARLLAAKKGRVTGGTNSPAQASTPEVPPTVSEAITTATPDFVKTPTPEIPVVTEEAPTPVAQEIALPSLSEITSPTSNRDVASIADASSRGFSIPGLFMTADDHVDPGLAQTRPKVNTDRVKARMAELKADMLRKKALQDGMPVLNAEVEKTRDRLTEQRTKLATIREDILTKEHQLSRAREDETRLLEEIEELEKQLADGENGQKQFSRELTQLNDHITEQEKEAIAQQSVADTTDSMHATQLSDMTSVPVTDSAVAIDEDQIVDNEMGEEFSSAQSLESTGGSENHELKDDVVMEESGFVDPEYPETEPYETQSMHMTTTATASNVPSVHENDNNDDDDDDDERMSIDGISDDGSGGSASMSDSGSEYEPAVDQYHASMQPSEGEDNNEYNPLNADTPPNQSQIEIDNDEYEPSENLDSINVNNVDEVHHDGNLPAEAKSLLGEPTTNQSPVMPAPAEELPITSTFPTRHSSVDRVVIAAKVDNETLTPQQNHSAPSDAYEEIQPLDNKLGLEQSYTPYRSPLTMLKSFRFHPQFSELVPNGYRSLTYSNQVDSNRPLCTTELEGKMCTDTECEDQHFAGMALTDDKILVQMSSAFDIKDKAQRDAYLIGLKKVIADLREMGVKEFSEVAGALSKYRREWKATQDGIVV